jgi:hypothetical protein
MHRSIRYAVASAVIALTVSSAHAGSLPSEIGACTETKIKEVTTRLGTPDSGTVVQYANVLIQISYETIAPATRSKPATK